MLPSLESQLCQLRLVSRFSFRLGEKINLLSDDFATVTSDVLVVRPLGIMDSYLGTIRTGAGLCHERGCAFGRACARLRASNRSNWHDEYL